MADLLATTSTVSSHFWNTAYVWSPDADWDLINDLSQKAATEYQDITWQEFAALMPASCSFSPHFLPLHIFCANAFSLKTTFSYFSIYILITMVKKKALILQASQICLMFSNLTLKFILVLVLHHYPQQCDTNRAQQRGSEDSSIRTSALVSLIKVMHLQMDYNWKWKSS